MKPSMEMLHFHRRSSFCESLHSVLCLKVVGSPLKEVRLENLSARHQFWGSRFAPSSFSLSGMGRVSTPIQFGFWYEGGSFKQHLGCGKSSDDEKGKEKPQATKNRSVSRIFIRLLRMLKYDSRLQVRVFYGLQVDTEYRELIPPDRGRQIWNSWHMFLLDCQRMSVWKIDN